MRAPQARAADDAASLTAPAAVSVSRDGAVRPSLGRRLSGVVHGLAVGATLYAFLVVIFLVALPVLWRPRWTARVVGFFGDLVVPLTLWVGGIRVTSSGTERVEALGAAGGYILVANHASNLDPIALMKVIGRTDLAFVAKAETLRRPLAGRMLRAIGWFGVDRDSPLALKRFQEQVEARRKAGWNPDLVIFPEGTRSEDGRLQPFRMGPFLLAVRTGLPILPVIIRGTQPLHRKNAFAVHPGPVSVDVLAPIHPPRKVGAAQLVTAVTDLMAQVEGLYRDAGDLNQADSRPLSGSSR